MHIKPCQSQWCSMSWGLLRDVPVNALPPAQSWEFATALSKPVGIVWFSPVASGLDLKRLSTFPGSISKLFQRSNWSAMFLHTSQEIQDFFSVKQYVCRQIWAEHCYTILLASHLLIITNEENHRLGRDSCSPAGFNRYCMRESSSNQLNSGRIWNVMVLMPGNLSLWLMSPLC